ncbi:unnamed protein product [Rodentolepis nana]|uniref:Uncharacterized protein n=1 Tax=Rodentolepis nana TaxID=102285 RepID=A0A0R3TY51_RODNA|nr:unnamed protein product [Rodentolepis nana]
MKIVFIANLDLMMPAQSKRLPQPRFNVKCAAMELFTTLQEAGKENAYFIAIVVNQHSLKLDLDGLELAIAP